MARKKQSDPVILPDLALVSFSDMMTLMLTFFVLLFSMSEIRKEKVVKAVNALRNQLGIAPAQKSPLLPFTPSQRMSQTQAHVLRRGPPGKTPEVLTLMDDQRMTFVVGGEEVFGIGSAVLLPTARGRLRTYVAPDLRGFRNRIEVRGHATPDEDRDPWLLAGQRALATMRFLVDECGIDENRFRVVSCGDKEPRDSSPSAANRRVEVTLTEYLVRGGGP